MSRAIGAHIPRGDRQHQCPPRPPSDVEVHGYWTPGPPWPRTSAEPDPVHHDPHQCPTCGMCLCACEDCHTRLARFCICPDCPCGLGETGSAAEVAAFEATHWKHAEETP